MDGFFSISSKNVQKSLNISFITCFCHFIELLIPYFETATDFNSFGTKCRMP